MLNIVITTSSFGQYDDSPLELCKTNGLKTTINPYKRKIKPDELVQFARGAVGLIAGTETISEETMIKLPVLKVISRCGAGIDNVKSISPRRS